MFGILLYIPTIVVGPRLTTLGLKLPPFEHTVVGFHPRGRTPRRGEELERTGAGNFLGSFDQGKQQLLIMLNCKMFEVVVADDIVVGVASQRKIAAIDMRAAETIAVSQVGVEISFEKFLLLLIAQLRVNVGSRLGERTPKPSIVW